MTLSKDRPPLLDYVTKLMLLELIHASAMQDVDAAIWIQKTLTKLHYRWEELDGR